MPDIDIKYADPPGFVVFSISPHHQVYALTHVQSAIKREDHLFEIGAKNRIETNNIDEWIRLHTSNNHSLQTLMDLAFAFRSGYENAYGIDDVQDCGQTVFYIMKDLLFHNGFAAKYADIFDIECIPASDLRRSLRDEAKANDWKIPPERISRFINVCLHNGLHDLVEILEKVLNKIKNEGTIHYPDSTTYDNDIKKLIAGRISKAFTRHKQYEQYRKP